MAGLNAEEPVDRELEALADAIDAALAWGDEQRYQPLLERAGALVAALDRDAPPEIAALVARVHVARQRALLLAGERGEAPVKVAIELLQDLVRREPHRALLHALLADAYLVRCGMSNALVQVAMSAGCRRHAQRALALDPGCAIAHAALGILLLFVPRAFGGSARSAREHLELALSASPARPDWMAFHARACLECGDEQAAHKVRLSLQEMSPTMAAQLDELITGAGSGCEEVRS